MLPVGTVVRSIGIIAIASLSSALVDVSPGHVRKAIAYPLLLAAMAIVFCAALYEILAGSLFPPHQSFKIFAAHPEMGIAWRPDSTQVQHVVNASGAVSHTYAIDISSQGLRDREYGPKVLGEVRIALLGDSFASGTGVDISDTPSRLLEAELQSRFPDRTIYVINGGTPGHGVWQARANLEARILPLEPDIVIHQMYLTNDIHDELQRTREVLLAYSPEQLYFWQTRKYRQCWNVQADAWLLEHSAAYQRFVWATNAEYTVMRALGEVRLFGAFLPPDYPDSIKRTPFLEHALVSRYPMLDRSLSLIRESILSTKALCEEKGIRYCAYAQPDRGYGLREQIPVGPHGEIYNRENDVELLESIYRVAGIDYLPFGKILRESARVGGAFFEYDPHMTREGNAILAAALAEKSAQFLQR